MPALLMIAVLAFAAAACGTSPDSENPQQNGSAPEHQDGHSEHSEEHAPTAPKVKLDLPEDAKAGEEVSIQITVTHEGEPVNDADEVQFEIWKKGAPKDDHEMMDAEKTGDGVYSVKKTFREPGEYKVMYHVTARGSHVMEPADTLVVQ
jgi:hypothetical protein